MKNRTILRLFLALVLVCLILPVMAAQARADGISVLVLPVDGNGDPVSGAELTVQEDPVSPAWGGETWTSGSETGAEFGTDPHLVEGLSAGKTYRIHETMAPGMCELADDVTFTVSENGVVSTDPADAYDLTGTAAMILVRHKNALYHKVWYDVNGGIDTQINAPIGLVYDDVRDGSDLNGSGFMTSVSIKHPENKPLLGYEIYTPDGTLEKYVEKVPGYSYIIKHDVTVKFIWDEDAEVDQIRVVIIPGAYTEGETVEQNVISGKAMVPVTFTASVGFLFPKNWQHDPTYGLTYTRDMNKMTVSGIPVPKDGEKTITIQLPDGWFGVESGPTQQNVVWHAVDPQNVTVTVSSSEDSTQYEVIKADVKSLFIPPNTIQYTATAKASNGTVYTNVWTESIPVNRYDRSTAPAFIPVPLNPGYSTDGRGRTSEPVTVVPEQPQQTEMPAAPAAEEPALPFKDVSERNPYYKGILYAYRSGLMNGILPTEFNPYGSLTRAMFVTILGRLDGVDPALYGTSTFTDCSALGDWDYAPYVEWAAKKGIVLGYGDGTFGPMDPVTNEQAVLMLRRYAKVLGEDDSVLAGITFPEGTKISPWAFDAVAWSYANSVYPTETDAAPTAPAERGWMAQAVYNFVGYLIR